MSRKPGVPHRSTLRIARDRREIARRYLQGEYQADIGKALGLTQQMISYELKAIRQAWKEEATQDFLELQARELAHIDLVERTYWEGWERSKMEHSRRTQVIRPGADNGSQPEVQLFTVRTDETVGDTRWLEGVQWCIEKRCAILGLNAPLKSAQTTPDGAEALPMPSVVIYRPSRK